MNVTVEKHPKCLTEVSTTFPANEVVEERSSIINSYSTQARIPGFRPGKAPKKVIEKRFAKEIEGELETQFLSKLVQHTTKEEKINFLNIKDSSCTHEENGDLSTNIKVVVAPEFELGEYKNIPVTVPKLEVTDEIVENEILTIRRQQAKYPTKEEGAAEKDDVAVISYTANYEGKSAPDSFEDSIAPYDTQEDYWIKIGGDHFLPGFSDELVNMVVGSEKVIPHTFADDFSLEALRGKTLDYTVTLKEIKSEELPAEEDIAKQMSADGNEGSVEAFREQVKNYVEQRLEKQSADAKAGAVLEALGKDLEFELPEDYLTAETQSQADQLVRQGMSYGLGEEEVVKMQENIIETATANAQQSLKNHFILQKVADLEKIEVTKEEVAQKAMMEAYQRGENPQNALKEIQKSGGYQHEQAILMDKVVAFLVDNADVTEEEPKS